MQPAFKRPCPGPGPRLHPLHMLQLPAPPRRLHAAAHVAGVGLVAVAAGAADPGAAHADAGHAGRAGGGPGAPHAFGALLARLSAGFWQYCPRKRKQGPAGGRLPAPAEPLCCTAVAQAYRTSHSAPPACQCLQSRLCVQAQLQGLLIGTVAASLLRGCVAPSPGSAIMVRLPFPCSAFRACQDRPACILLVM